MARSWVKQLTNWLSNDEDAKIPCVQVSGSALIGKVGIDQTTDGATNKVQARNATADNFNVNANLQVGDADNSEENPAFVQVTGSKTEDITFQDAATAAADGTAFTVEGYKTLTVEITRTAGTSTVAFIGEGASGADIALMGINLSTFATATSTTGTGELWQFDITGLTKVFMDLTAVATGSVTVKGKAVA